MPFDQAIADFICDEIVETGNSLRQIFRDHKNNPNSPQLPGWTTFFKWLDENESFANQYARACNERVEAFREDIKDIADEAVGQDAAGVQAAKLRIETRKWLMGKANPKKYGDRVQVDNTHSFEAMSDDDLVSRRNNLLKASGIPILESQISRASTDE